MDIKMMNKYIIWYILNNNQNIKIFYYQRKKLK